MNRYFVNKLIELYNFEEEMAEQIVKSYESVGKIQDISDFLFVKEVMTIVIFIGVIAEIA
jgi:hypothetical protein